ncbi:hypothetical protein RRG08_042172 [Elysia crispata]|uniref:Uncharacterized protein n=1 Tax=Elysia crispata TaxID=231223 RepID=A0AAE1DAK5_9GAST|nr:hypothetical protein RRG08_042172 [Elysia crispata]
MSPPWRQRRRRNPVSSEDIRWASATLLPVAVQFTGAPAAPSNSEATTTDEPPAAETEVNTASDVIAVADVTTVFGFPD